MSAPYRTSEASLRAEVERLTRALAVARARRRWRWRVEHGGGWQATSAAALSALWVAYIVREGWTTANIAGATTNAAQWIVWALCFLRGAQRDGDDLRTLATATWRALGETGDVPNRTAEIVYRARGVRAERDAAEAALADIAEAAGVPYMGAQGLAGVVRLRIAALPSPAEAAPAAAGRGR